MEDLERIQVSARKWISGSLNVYLCLTLIFLSSISTKVQLFSIVVFTFLGFYAVGRKYLRVLEVPVLFLLPSILVILLTIEGKPIFEFWFFSVSDKALEVVKSTLLRVFAILSILTYLISTTTLPEFISALKKLRIPKFLVEIMFLSYRAIQVLMGELKKFETSANLRLGYIRFRTSVSTKSLLAKTIFLRAMDRIEKTILAMDLRGEEFPDVTMRSKGFVIAIAIFSVSVILCLR
ncbi:MAG: energy-coupling factor transporter transmembrane component T family protein [Archaeoglobaceae archaeon]